MGQGRQQLSLSVQLILLISQLLQLTHRLPDGILRRQITAGILRQLQRLGGSVELHLRRSQLLGILQMLFVFQCLLMVIQQTGLLFQFLLSCGNGGELIFQRADLLQFPLQICKLTLCLGDQTLFVKPAAVFQILQLLGQIVGTSGFIAGGALMGVVSAAMRFAGLNLLNAEWQESNAAGMLAVVVYLALIGYLTYSSMKAEKE